MTLINLAWIDRNQPLFGPWLQRRMPTWLTELPDRYPALDVILRTGLLLGTFLVIKLLVEGLGTLDASNYSQPVLALELARTTPIYLTAGLVIATAFLLLYGALFMRWQAFDDYAVLRAFVLFLAALLVWPLVTTGYNHYFDQGYYLDRLLLVVLLALLWWRPVFVLPLCLLVMALLWQTMEPRLGSGSFIPHKRQLLLVLEMFGALLVLRAAFGIRRMDVFWMLVLCIVAAMYWQPALAKLRLGWMSYGHLYHMPLAAHAHGWLSFVEPEKIVAFAQFIERFDLPMQVFVIVIEAGCLLLLANRKLAIALLASVITFHLSVFALYGFNFWGWILLDAAIITILVRDRGSPSLAIHTQRHVMVSIVLIAFAAKWCGPPTLAWFDTRLSYTYRYSGIGESGTVYEIPNEYFKPYEDPFTMSGFSYLVDEHPGIVRPYGITVRREQADALLAATTAPLAFQAEQEAGRHTYKPDRERVFLEFIQTFVTHRNAAGPRGEWLTALAPPRQFWSFPRGNPYLGQEPLAEVRIREVTTLYDGVKLFPIRDLELHRLSIPAD